jgi:hypothetical protein
VCVCPSPIALNPSRPLDLMAFALSKARAAAAITRADRPVLSKVRG